MTEPNGEEQQTTERSVWGLGMVLLLIAFTSAIAIFTHSYIAAVCALGLYLGIGGGLDYRAYGDFEPSSLKTIVLWAPRGFRVYLSPTCRSWQPFTFIGALQKFYPERTYSRASKRRW